MQFSSVFVYLLLSVAVAAKGNKTTKAVTDKSLCKEMASLTKLVHLASNTTKLDAKTKSNATKVCSAESYSSIATTDIALHRLPKSNLRHQTLPLSCPLCHPMRLLSQPVLSWTQLRKPRIAAMK